MKNVFLMMKFPMFGSQFSMPIPPGNRRGDIDPGMES